MGSLTLTFEVHSVKYICIITWSASFLGFENLFAIYIYITNKLSHKSCYTSGGKCSTTDTIYAAECTRHNTIFVGQSSQKLNSRFNGHRSDVKVKPKACELSQHFHNNKECSIDRELKIYILQDNVTGSWEEREYFEDRWITRLNSKAPNGMNSNLKEFAKTFYALF